MAKSKFDNLERTVKIFSQYWPLLFPVVANTGAPPPSMTMEQRAIRTDAKTTNHAKDNRSGMAVLS